LIYYFIFMHFKKALKYFCDLLFFICQAFIVYQVIYNINNGIIPIYCYFLIGAGFLIYYNFSQKYYQQQIYPLKKVTRVIFIKVIRVSHNLFVKPFINTYTFFKDIYLLIKKLIIKLIKNVDLSLFKNKNKKNAE